MIKKTFLLFIFVQAYASVSGQFSSLVPTNTATHTAIADGSWFSAATWDAGTVPGDAAIVVIPSGITVDYQGSSSSHVFAIRVDGTFNCTQTAASDTTKLTVDTFIGMSTSFTKFHAQNASDGDIEVMISPFDIEAHKAGTSGYTQVWNADAISHFSDGAAVDQVEREVVGDYRHNSYAEAIASPMTINELSRVAYDDGTGVTGRYGWDSTQLSLGLVTMGQIEIIGKEKLGMSKLAADAVKAQKQLILETTPTGWEVGDTILVTRDGNVSTTSRGEDVEVIASISGDTINCVTNLSKNHLGNSAAGLHCYVGNLTRNITFQSGDVSNTHRRGHLMVMHNDSNIQIKNAAFKNLGRTDKSRQTDDFIFSQWIQHKVFKCKTSALGQEVCEMQQNPKADITNIRGRYSIHLHKTGATYGDSMAYVTGNVVWGNPGWAITQHDSYATISDNVVYSVIGAGIVSESGSELGFWDNNLVVDVQKGHTKDKYESALLFDDLLFSGQGLGMKGRGVVCRNNVIANANEAVGIMNMNPSTTNLDRVDAKLLATARPQHLIDHFPLDQNGYSIEADGVLPVEVALIMENTTAIWCYQGLRSIERDMGVNHESRSIFDGFNAWGCVQGLSIVYQSDYSFKNVYLSGKNLTSSIGMFLWKHSHNHVFENIKMEDLAYGITVSKLVESGSAMKTRNNGQTPWYFIDLQTNNVGNLYQIEKENTGTSTLYLEHSDNPVHLSSASEVASRPTTFTITDSTEMLVDVGSEDFQFKVDGIVSDDLGCYDMGIKQADAQGTLRIDYPERIYEFASQAKFEEYLTNNGVYKDTANGDQLYFIVNEYLPNRRTYAYTQFPIRIKINNAPATGVYASPAIEAALYTDNPYQMASRFATATQSSTATGVTYYEAAYDSTATVDVSASKAIDGNNNGRINCQILQQGLLPLGSFSQTNSESEPWYELDLGKVMDIGYIDVWNTVELNGANLETHSTTFSNFYVLISDTPFGSSDLTTARGIADYEYFETGLKSSNKRRAMFNNLNAIGRYVRIQAQGTTTLKLAEVEVLARNYTASTPLPLELGNFKAEPHPDGSLKSRLSWETLTETNTSHFEIEHGLDVQNFRKIGVVEAAGNSSSIQYYQFVHPHPGRDNNYYRLKMVDIDGHYEYSAIEVVRFDPFHPIVKMYPNPVGTGNDLYLLLEGFSGRIELKLFDVFGKVVKQVYVRDGLNKVSIPGLASGVYFYEVYQGQREYFGKVVVN